MSENYKPLTQRREVAKDSLEKLAKRRQNRLANQDLMDFYQNLSVLVSLRLCVKEFSDTFSDLTGFSMAQVDRRSCESASINQLELLGNLSGLMVKYELLNLQTS